MKQYARQTEQHIQNMINQLCICDDFEQMLFQCSLIAH